MLTPITLAVTREASSFGSDALEIGHASDQRGGHLGKFVVGELLVAEWWGCDPRPGDTRPRVIVGR